MAWAGTVRCWWILDGILAGGTTAVQETQDGYRRALGIWAIAGVNGVNGVNGVK